MKSSRRSPILNHIGEKNRNNCVCHIIPQDVEDIIFKELKDSSAQLRIMIVLIGTKPGFKISEKWMLDRTGLVHQSYLSARKKLINRGWINHEESKNISVNFDKIYEDGNRGNTTLPNNENRQCDIATKNIQLDYNDTKIIENKCDIANIGNTTLPQCSNIKLPITNNKYINTNIYLSFLSRVYDKSLEEIINIIPEKVYAGKYITEKNKFALVWVSNLIKPSNKPFAFSLCGNRLSEDIIASEALYVRSLEEKESIYIPTQEELKQYLFDLEIKNKKERDRKERKRVDLEKRLAQCGM